MVSEERTGEADVQDVAEFAQGLSTAFLLCRELQHNWKPFSAWWDEEHHNYARVIRCVRCRTKKVQRLSTTGAVLSSHYEYADGYLAEHIGRIIGEARDSLRLESLLRALGGPQAVEAPAPRPRKTTTKKKSA